MTNPINPDVIGTDNIALNIREGAVSASDIALINDIGKENLQSVNFLLINNRQLAYQRADRLLRELSYPALNISIVVNRVGYKLQVGDFFKLTFAQYNLTERVFRIISIVEHDPKKDTIEIKAIESIDYISNSIPSTEETQDSESTFEILALEAFISISLFETVYSLADSNFTLTPVIGRRTLAETGYNIYYSIDNGVSYNFLETGDRFGILGTLNEAIYIDNHFLPDIEIVVTIANPTTNTDIDQIEEITNNQMFERLNIAIIDSEIISFKKLVLNDDNTTYTMTGVNRGLLGSVMAEHTAFTEITFIRNVTSQISNINFSYGASLYFKFTPYNAFSTGDISEAYAIPYVFTGTAFKPYPVHNLKADSYYGTSEWTSGNDIVIEWESSLRGSGCGTMSMESELQDVTIEGVFKIEIVKDSTIYRTVTGLTDTTYTYTDANIYSDFSSTYPDYFDINVYNILTATDGITYSSRQSSLTVNKAL